MRAKTGTTIEVNNTDAEGRLVLADCLAHAIDLGAERLVDLATLTGAIVVALGRTYAGLFANDDAWAAEVAAAGERTGEIVWRMPLHAEYAKAIEGRYGDIVNSPAERGAGSATAAEFLHRFVGDVPWAHLDIAGTAYDGGAPVRAQGRRGLGRAAAGRTRAGGPGSPDLTERDAIMGWREARGTLDPPGRRVRGDARHSGADRDGLRGQRAAPPAGGGVDRVRPRRRPGRRVPRALVRRLVPA